MTCVDCGQEIPTPTPDAFRCPACRVGAGRVTDFRIDEVEMRAEDFWALPADTRRLIATYGARIYEHADGRVTFNMAIYRWTEIQRTLHRLQGQP